MPSLALVCRHLMLHRGTVLRNNIVEGILQALVLLPTTPKFPAQIFHGLASTASLEAPRVGCCLRFLHPLLYVITV